MATLRFLRGIMFPILALLCLMIGACEEPPTGSGPATGFEKVSGILNDEQGYIVPGAFVEAFNGADARLAVDTSDEAGTFALTGLPKDLRDVQIRVRHSDFKPFETAVTGLISTAGGTEGVIMNLFSSDSCCAVMTVKVTTTDNRPLPGVEVKLRRGRDVKKLALTDSNGIVTFTGVCAGEYNIRLAKERYEVIERDGINVHGCDPTRLEFTMRQKDNGGGDDSCCNGKLRIIPRDSTTNAVITGAQVQIKRQGGNTRTETSGENGALFRELCEGTYSVRIAKDGYRVVEFSIALHCNDSLSTERRMVRKEDGHDSCCDGKAIIIPRDSTTNDVLNGAQVKLWKGNNLLGTKTVQNGNATFSDLCKGEYVGEITREGYKRIEFRFSLDCNQRSEITKKLVREQTDSCCNGSLTVVVRDSSNNATIRNATVKLWKNGQLLATKTTDSNGVARFEHLCKGNYGVDLIREGYKSREFTTELGCNQNKETTQYLIHKEDGPCCTAKFVFVAKDSLTGSRIAGVAVEIRKGNDLIARGETNGEGKYVREAICGNATYTITFTKEGYQTRTKTIVLGECRIVEETIWMFR